MSKAIGLLFPWRGTYRRLEIERYWWHRLAVVVLFASLIPMFLYSWVIADDVNLPTHMWARDIQYWEILPVPPVGNTITPTDPQLDENSFVPFTPTASPPDEDLVGHGKIATPIFGKVGNHQSDGNVRKTVEMPNGTTATYSGIVPDETIKAEWQHKLKVAKAREILLGIGTAVMVTLIFSYLLQMAYRALVYVIFGTPAKATPDTPAAT
jgi:hypothetical protein